MCYVTCPAHSFRSVKKDVKVGGLHIWNKNTEKLAHKGILTRQDSVKKYKDMKFQMVEHMKTKWVNFMDQRVLLMGWRYRKETRETELRHFIALCTYGLTCDIITYMFLMQSHIFQRGSLSI
jgi:hypothetical protein